MSDLSLSGVQLIADERRRQINVEGWTAEHDDEHTKGELIIASICYAIQPTLPDEIKKSGTPSIWPWEDAWWKPSEDPIRNLVKAGALLAAEIDRRQREL